MKIRMRCGFSFILLSLRKGHGSLPFDLLGQIKVAISLPILLLLIGLTWNIPTYAADSISCRQIFQTLNTAQEEIFCYRPGGFCYDNIYNFSLLLKKVNVDLGRTQIVFIYKKSQGVSRAAVNPKELYLQPRQTRDGFGTEWKLHVVLVHDGLVYDFDTSKDPKPVDIKSWYYNMWPSPVQSQKNDKGRSIQVFYKRIRAFDYLNFHKPEPDHPLSPTGQFDPHDWINDPNAPAIEKPFLEFLNDPLFYGGS